MCMAADAAFDYTTILRAYITWIIKDVPVASPTEAQLLALTDGDYCGIMPAACKNGPFGLHFAWEPIWLPVHGAPANRGRQRRQRHSSHFRLKATRSGIG